MCLRRKPQLLVLTFRVLCEGNLSTSLISFLILFSLFPHSASSPTGRICLLFSFVLNILNLYLPWASVFLIPSTGVPLQHHGCLFFFLDMASSNLRYCFLALFSKTPSCIILLFLKGLRVYEIICIYLFIEMRTCRCYFLSCLSAPK